MKLLTIIGITAAATIASSQAATVNVSGGFGVGVLVTTTLVNTASTFEVGGYQGGIFTAFAAPAVNLAAGSKIAGSFAGSSPTSLNNSAIFFRVTTPDGFAILSATGATFPADVTSGILSSSVTFSSSASGGVAAFGGAKVTGVTFTDANHLNFAVVPEPSAALLGAVGALGLLRRRRN